MKMIKGATQSDESTGVNHMMEVFGIFQPTFIFSAVNYKHSLCSLEKYLVLRHHYITDVEYFTVHPNGGETGNGF